MKRDLYLFMHRKNRRKNLLARFFSLRTVKRQQQQPLEEEVLLRENPYLPRIREIVEQILQIKDIPYGEFYPVFIDGSDSLQCLEAAKALSFDLNRLLIFTEKPAYFSQFAENMYEEQGLIVEIFPKTDTITGMILGQKWMGNVVLDFEQPARNNRSYVMKEKIYIPIFKRCWECTEHPSENARNLDIAVPIGYNTVIVSIGEQQEMRPCLDKFERAFWSEHTE